MLANLGGKRLAEIGLGDDQDPDAYQTGYQIWESLIWQALGVDKIEGLPEEPPRKFRAASSAFPLLADLWVNKYWIALTFCINGGRNFQTSCRFTHKSYITPKFQN